MRPKEIIIIWCTWYKTKGNKTSLLTIRRLLGLWSPLWVLFQINLVGLPGFCLDFSQFRDWMILTLRYNPVNLEPVVVVPGFGLFLSIIRNLMPT